MFGFESKVTRYKKTHFRAVMSVIMQKPEPTKIEIALLEEIGSNIGLSKKQMDSVVANMSGVKMIPHESKEGRQLLMIDMVRVAIVDGEISELEREACAHMARELDINPAVIDGILGMGAEKITVGSRALAKKIYHGYQYQ